MSRNIKRLLFSAALSTSGILGTIYWYESGNKSFNDYGNKKPIARLVQATNEVQRKPLKRVIWHTISKNEDLYAGEAIRTSNTADAAIKFLSSGTVIELEEDSLIVLEENNGELALDFLKGNLFVKDGGSAKKDSLKLKSGENQIDLSGAELSLGKQDSGQLNLQVLSGQAQVQANGKSITLDNSQSGTIGANGVEVQKNKIKVIGPLAGKTLYINPKTKVPTSFKWQPISEDYWITLEVGTSRKSLKKYNDKKVSAKIGIIQAQLKAGRLFWRFVARSKTNPTEAPIFSPIFKNEVKAKLPPILLEPGNSEKITLRTKETPLVFRWANPTDLSNMVIEVATDKNLRNKVIQQSINESDFLEFADTSKLKNGTYFWRVTGYINKKEPLTSSIQSFKLKIGTELTPPKLLSPIAEQNFPFSTVAKGEMDFKWEKIEGIKNYKFLLKFQKNKDFLIDKVISGNFHPISELKPGDYQWQVHSIGSKGKVSKPSEIRTFRILEIPTVKWANNQNEAEWLYTEEHPTLGAKWIADKDQTLWRYRWSESPGDLDKKKWVQTTKNSFIDKVKKDGSYYIEVEAVTKNNKVLAKSSTKKVQVQMRPLLPAPQFAEALPPQLKAQRNGSMELYWTDVNGAQEYSVELTDKNGKVIEVKNFKNQKGLLRKLKPGKYNVTVKAKDEFGRFGLPAKVRPLTVPSTSHVKAPKLKAIKVK